ncbi:MAG TPA: hypothetical protein VHD56_09500, partial [Tepidisphaeraceae bacterium]|nr:hypothetical protein [Tepidisphaeraceae bacterium]
SVCSSHAVQIRSRRSNDKPSMPHLQQQVIGSPYRRIGVQSSENRSNTAKLLARLKELKVLKDVLSGTNATFVLGPGELLRSLVATKVE